MPFRLWFYLTKIGGWVFATVIVLALAFGDDEERVGDREG